MSEEKGLTVVEQKQVEFYGDQIIAVQMKDGDVLVPIRPICDLVGVTWPSQRNRIGRDAVLSVEARNVSVFVTNTQGQGQRREMLCLPLDYISGFLFGLNADRVKPELRERVILYQRECYRVLAEAFHEGRLTADPVFEELLQQDTDTVQAYKMLQAMVKLARNQILLEARLDDHGQLLADHGRRLENIEADLHQKDRYISESQATQISQAVKTIAIALGKQTGRNEFGAVWGEFYRRFGIAKYRYLPISRFEEALTWLNEFYQDLTGESPF